MSQANHKNAAWKQVEEFVRRRISYLESQAESNPKALAELRRGIGKEPGELPQLWQYILYQLPPEMEGRYGPSREEWAIYLALTLFALHQQGRTKSMMETGVSLGKAIAKLVKRGDEFGEERVTRRFTMVAGSSDVRGLSVHLRGVIQLLRSGEITLDYGKLASDLYMFQSPSMRAKVLLQWGQDYYGALRDSKLSETEAVSEVEHNGKSNTVN